MRFCLELPISLFSLKMTKLFEILVLIFLSSCQVKCIINNPHYTLPCVSDDNCGSKRSLLFCLQTLDTGTRMCQCLRQAVQNYDGIRYHYDMEWSPEHNKCVSKIGSTCTLPNNWHDSSIQNLDCVVGSVCSPSSSNSASSSSSISTGYDSAINFGDHVYPYNRRFGNAASSFGICTTPYISSIGNGLNNGYPQTSSYPREHKNVATLQKLNHLYLIISVCSVLFQLVIPLLNA